MAEGKPKLLLVGPTSGSVHVKNFYFLVRDYFQEVLVLTNEEIDFAEYKLANFSIKNPLTIKRQINQIQRVIDQFNPDIIHIHQANSCAYLTLKANKKNIPTVLTTWGSDVLLNPQKSFILKHITKFALNKASWLTADAQYMIDAIKKLSNNENVSLLNFGVDIDLNVDIPVKENSIYSNRLHKEIYNIDQIIEAFVLIKQQYLDWHLTIGANGDKTEKLRLLAGKILSADSYHFIGFVDAQTNKKNYLKSKIWVSIPSSDGTSISLLEAMAFGCIPVVSDLPANNEWIQDGVNGVVVKNTLIEAIKKAISMDYREVAKINMRIIEEKATKDVNRKKFYAIYDSILSN